MYKGKTAIIIPVSRADSNLGHEREAASFQTIASVFVSRLSQEFALTHAKREHYSVLRRSTSQQSQEIN